MNPNGRPKLKRKKLIRLKSVLIKTRLSKNKAAKLLGITDQTLHNWLKLGVPESEVSRVCELIRKITE